MRKRSGALCRNYDPSADPELQRVFDYALSQGVNLFDTADSYGTGALNGRSEELLGRFARERAGGAAGRTVHVATKLAGYPWRVTPWNMTAACRCARPQRCPVTQRGGAGAIVGHKPAVRRCRGSLRRLHMEQLSIGQLHWSAAKYAPLQEWAQVRGLARCAREGLVAEVGVSNYGAQQLRKVRPPGLRRGSFLHRVRRSCGDTGPRLQVHRELAEQGVTLASAQVQLSLLSWGAPQQELVRAAEELGVAVIAYSPLALGILTGKYDAAEGRLPRGPRGQLMKGLLPQVEPVLAEVRAVATARRKSCSQVRRPRHAAVSPRVPRAGLTGCHACAGGDQLVPVQGRDTHSGSAHDGHGPRQHRRARVAAEWRGGGGAGRGVGGVAG